jgi:hypothetical protein
MPAAKRQRTSKDTNGADGDLADDTTNGKHYEAPEDINEDPDRVKFA